MLSLAAPDLLDHSARVLVVSFDPARQARHARLLLEGGFQCIHPPTPSGALSRLGHVDAVLLEIGPRDPEGWELCRTIRRRFRRMPLVVLTPESDAGVMGQLFGIGVDDQLEASCTPEALVARLRYRIGQRRADAEASRNQERALRVVRDAAVPLFTTRDGWVTFANPRLAEFTGHASAADLSAKTIHDLVVEEDRPSLARALKRCCEGREDFLRFPLRLLRRGGEPREVELHLSRIPGEPGEACVGTIIDVNRRRKAVEREQLRTDYFRSLIEEGHDIIVVLDREGAVQYLSPSVNRILGLDPEAVVGRPLLPLLHPADARRTTELLRWLVEGNGSVVGGRCRLRNAAGEWRAIEFTARDLLHLSPVEGIVVNARDVTNPDAMEAALRQSEERFRLMVEGSPDVFFYSRTPEGRLLYLSPSVTPVLGHSPTELVGSTLEWLLREGETEVDAAGHPASHRLVQATTQSGESLTLELVESGMSQGEKGMEVHGFARDVSERERLQTALRDAAFQDSLTGLPNRALFIDRLNRAILRRQRNPDAAFALLFLDLDRFKVVNDSLGHGIGDHLLVAVADRLRLHLRPEDTFARFGGDEFAILIEDLAGPADSTRVARRIVEVLSTPFDINGFEIYTSSSIGIVLGADSAACAESLLRNADMAMYRAKGAGGGTFELYDQPMHTLAVQRLQLETQLRRALERDELQLHFQPIIRLVDGTVAGAEGLLRWNHPTKGLIAPADFIGLAEETGFITAIGGWGLEIAAVRLVEWQSAFGGPDFFVSVNLSAREVFDATLVPRVKAILRETGLRPDSLRLEITENILIENTDRAARTLRTLADLGIHIYLDDFGTGYASLGHLHRLPLHGLKIDRSFIARMCADTRYGVLVESTMTIAKALGLTVIAEGIEEAEQAHALTGLFCDFAQGFYFAHPAPGDELPAAVQRFHSAGLSR